MSLLHALKITIATLFICISLQACQHITPENSRHYERTSPYPFEETLLNLDIAITEYNYRITHRSDIGEAIRERGEPDFPLVSIIYFCNITYAREILLINANDISDMSCQIAVREQADQVIISTKLMAEHLGNAQQRAFAQRMNQNIRAIIEASLF